jgi:hypothetical protein
MAYGAAILLVCGAHVNARYDMATMGTYNLIAKRKVLVLSIIGEVTAEVTRPTPISKAPAIPASFSLKEYGWRIWLMRDEMLLKSPT